ncbi:hypothetical protein QP919_02355 [Corynebacterium propinquum]|uniref:Uncharacterized protein n=1 Tax=Corynebacterium propinquum TaxID=43769 RepID=A0AAP4F6K6_9CORY|nr:hypothetical protein [Corynebacterium propinquum]MDK4326242.1 hypothetical protein [Corynebacterium propinquum]MDK8665652.1 hypothetical protein [Corynebacterium propinquum]MDK8722245.1 hypothetical protein [Corynebacterium propinquum]QQU85800.1 hypothetical protein I6I70_08770 [Corynebacterium propinquum]
MNGQAEIFLDIVAAHQETTFSSVLENIGVGIASVISGVLDPIFQLVTSSSK